jgi:hypothetical protein
MKDAEMRKLNTPGMKWMMPSVIDWLAFWKEKFGADGFNPFDSLAVGALVDRKDLICSPMSARIEKAQFLVTPGKGVTYCYDVKPGFKADLLRRLGK